MHRCLRRWPKLTRESGRESGYSLVEIAVVTAIVGVVAYSSMSLMVSTEQSNFLQKFSNDVATTDQTIRTLMTDANACLNTFTGITLTGTTNATVSAIKDSTGTTKYDLTTVYGDKTTKLYSISLSNYGDVSGVNGTAKITIAYAPSFSNGPGVNTLRSFRISTVKDSSNVLIACTAGSSQGQSSLWAKSLINQNDLYYQNGFVGIGTTQPITPLHVVAIKDLTTGLKTIADIKSSSTSQDPALSIGYLVSGTTVVANTLVSGNNLPLAFYKSYDAAGNTPVSMLKIDAATGFVSVGDHSSDPVPAYRSANSLLDSNGATASITNTSNSASTSINLMNCCSAGAFSTSPSIIATGGGTAGTNFLNLPVSLIFANLQAGPIVFAGSASAGATKGPVIFMANNTSGPETEILRVSTAANNGVSIGKGSLPSPATNPVATLDVQGRTSATSIRVAANYNNSEVIFDTPASISNSSLGLYDSGVQKWTFNASTTEFALNDALRTCPDIQLMAGGNLGLVGQCGSGSSPFVNLGIGTGATLPTGAASLTVSGVITPGIDARYDFGAVNLRFVNIFATNNVIQTSDLRMKEQINHSDLGLAFLNQLTPVRFKWTDVKDDDATHLGFIAQDTLAALRRSQQSSPSSRQPSGMITHDRGTDRYGLRYTELIAPIVRALSELANKLDQFSIVFTELMAAQKNQAAQHAAIRHFLCQNPAALDCATSETKAGR